MPGWVKNRLASRAEAGREFGTGRQISALLLKQCQGWNIDMTRSKQRGKVRDHLPSRRGARCHFLGEHYP